MIKRPFQLITSKFGRRWGILHAGVDLRSWRDDFSARLPVILPEDCYFVKRVYQEKWGWTMIFEPCQNTEYTEFKFIHVTNDENLIKDMKYEKGFMVGYAVTTDYMKKKGYGEHLHFETWKGRKPVDPVEYFKLRDISYKFKGE